MTPLEGFDSPPRRVSNQRDMLAIPAEVRRAVRERDAVCRMCGRSDHLICHHILFGGDAAGMGGRRFHDPSNIVLLGQGYDHQCHGTAHGDKRLWQPLLRSVVLMPGVTAFALWRWLRAGQDANSFGLPPDLVESLHDLGRRVR